VRDLGPRDCPCLFLVGIRKDDVADDGVHLRAGRDELPQRSARRSECVKLFVRQAVLSVSALEVGELGEQRVHDLCINRRMIIKFLSVVDCSILYFSNGVIYLGDCEFFQIVYLVGWCYFVKICLGLSKIGKRMKIMRMFDRRIGAHLKRTCNYSNQTRLKQKTYQSISDLHANPLLLMNCLKKAKDANLSTD